MKAPSAVPETAASTGVRVRGGSRAGAAAEATAAAAAAAVAEWVEAAAGAEGEAAAVAAGRDTKPVRRALPAISMEAQKMTYPRFRAERSRFFPLAIFLAALLALGFSTGHAPAATAKAKQKAFGSPEEAAAALVGALEKRDKAELSAIFGPGSESVISSGDEVSDRGVRDRFLASYAEKHSLDRRGDDTVILQVGNDEWPFPIPIARKGSAWRFDTKAGKEELLNRRIGANELRTIEVLHAYVAAQREYAAKDRDGDGVYPYAQKIASTPGKKDGLYWKAGEGEEPSPLGPLAAEASREGYTGKKGGDKPVPFHGYYFRILTAQGKHAPGGAYEYVVNGKMLLGFAMVAYPAQHGVSGVMTFVVNQEGVIYQKNLGKDTAKTAAAMKRYDPDGTWKKAEEPAAK
jgi:hypothetical protein